MFVKNKKKSLQKKEYFFFGSGMQTAKLIFKIRYSNFFFTLLDGNNKVVCCKTSGFLKHFKNKKRKTSLQAVEGIVNLFLPIFTIYGIKCLSLVFCDLPTSSSFRLLSYLESKHIIIASVKILLSYPHNGMRGRKARRV